MSLPPGSGMPGVQGGAGGPGPGGVGMMHHHQVVQQGGVPPGPGMPGGAMHPQQVGPQQHHVPQPQHPQQVPQQQMQPQQVAQQQQQQVQQQQAFPAVVSSDHHVEKLRKLSADLRAALTILMKSAAENVLSTAETKPQPEDPHPPAVGTKKEDLGRAFQEFYAICDQMEMTFATISTARKVNRDFAMYGTRLVNANGIANVQALQKDSNYQSLAFMSYQLGTARVIHDALRDTAANLGRNPQVPQAGGGPPNSQNPGPSACKMEETGPGSVSVSAAGDIKPPSSVPGTMGSHGGNHALVAPGSLPQTSSATRGPFPSSVGAVGGPSSVGTPAPGTPAGQQQTGAHPNPPAQQDDIVKMETL